MFLRVFRGPVGVHAVIALALAVSCLAGCGTSTSEPPPPDTSPTTTVSGKVTVAGKPFAGEGYALILMADNGASDIFSLSRTGAFNGTARVGALKAGVLPQWDAEAAHGDPTKLTSPVSVTIAVDASDLTIDLPTAPAALPAKARPAGGAHHGG
jgi:hypothetical protein